MNICIGVLSLQGCVLPHKFHIEALGAEFKEIKSAADLLEIHGLILPGGESTTMLKLIAIFELEQPLKNAFQNMPIWGICAGAILMAKKVSSPEQRSFGLLDIEIQRNAYGSQLNSFNATIEGSAVSFIRAPQIQKISQDTVVKAFVDKQPVWVQKDCYMATTFHPELEHSQPSVMHKEFLNLIKIKK